MLATALMTLQGARHVRAHRRQQEESYGSVIRALFLAASAVVWAKSVCAFEKGLGFKMNAGGLLKFNQVQTCFGTENEEKF